jgi:F-type H+-transporting ATPase subunit delta
LAFRRNAPASAPFQIENSRLPLPVRRGQVSRKSGEKAPVAQNGSQAETMISGVAGRYASALFELARDQRAVDAVAGDLDRFDALIRESPDLQRLVRSPVFTAEEQGKAVGAILDRAGIGGLAGNFIRLVATNRRLFALSDMIRAYRKLVAESKGIVRAQVRLAEPPSDRVLNDIKAALREVADAEVDVDVKVDPALIGGMVVQVGSRMVDASLRTKLNAIRLAMREAR